MRQTYSQLFEIFWMAKKGFKQDYETYKMESDLRAIENVETLLQYINGSNAEGYTIEEMPF